MQTDNLLFLEFNKIKGIVQNFHKTVLVGDYYYLSNNGQVSLDDFYEAIAWRGLKIHGVQAWEDLPQERKEETDQAYLQYISSISYYCA